MTAKVFLRGGGRIEKGVASIINFKPTFLNHYGTVMILHH